MAPREIDKTNLPGQDEGVVAKERSFEVGNEVVALIPIPGEPL